MKSRDKLDQKLRENVSIPMGLEWDDLAEGIYEKMPSKKKSSKRLFWIFLMLGILISTMAYLVRNTSQNAVAEVPSPKTEDLSSLNDESIITKTTSTNQEITVNKASDIATRKEEPTRIQSTWKTTTNQILDKGNKRDKLIAEATVTKKVDNAVRAITNKEKPIANTLSSATFVASNTYDKKDNTALARSPLEPSVTLGNRNLAPLDFQRSKESIPNAYCLTNKLNKSNNPSTHKWSMALVGSLVAWDQDYKDSPLLNKQNSEEKTILSYHAGIEGSYFISDKWSIFSGVDRSRLYSKYVGSFDSEIEVQYNNVVVLTEINPLHSQPTHHHGDTTVLRQAITSVSYYNFIDRWSVPLGIRYHTTGTKWQLMAGLGMQVGVYKTGEGVTARGELLTKYDAEQEIYQRGIDLAIRPEIGLQYAITNHIYAGLSINYQHHMINWSSESALELRPKILRSSLSAGYRW